MLNLSPIAKCGSLYVPWMSHEQGTRALGKSPDFFLNTLRSIKVFLIIWINRTFQFHIQRIPWGIMLPTLSKVSILSQLWSSIWRSYLTLGWNWGIVMASIEKLNIFNHTVIIVPARRAKSKVVPQSTKSICKSTYWWIASTLLIIYIFILFMYN